MREYIRKRLLPLVLAAALTLSLLPNGAARAAEAAVLGSISATLRIDYAQKLEEIQERSVCMEVLQGGTSVGTLELGRPGTYALGGAQAIVTARNTDGGELGGGSWPGYLDVEVNGLPRGTYTLRFTGRGYVTCEETVEMDKYACHVIVGTGDATFTLGDVNGDGQVDEQDRDSLSQALGSAAPADVERCDLSGDGLIDIVDLAYVNRQLEAQGEASKLETALLVSPLDQTAMLSEMQAVGTAFSGSLESLCLGDGQSVRFTSGDGDIVIPLPLTEAVEMSEIEIITPAGEGGVRAGTVLVEDEDGVETEIPFDIEPPDGANAISRTPGSSVITINLGTRVAVKKITVTVTRTEGGGYAAVEAIQFLRDIVPENPAPANSVVKGLKAVPGSESVSLNWNALPNVSGYKVLYWPQSSPSSVQELHVDVTSAVVSGLENLKTYIFTVTPTDGSWEGKPSEPAAATPMPSKVPDKTDMVSVSAMDGGLRVSWKAGKIATYYEVYYCEKGTEQWQQAGGQLTDPMVIIDNLTNGVTYTLYVVAGNDIGKGPRSDIAEGTPEAVKIERPEGIPTEGLLDRSKIQSVQLADVNNYDKNSYTAASPFAPENVIDDDYATHWTASTGGSNWNRNEHIIVTFTEPVDLSNALWVPRLDGPYPTYLRAYSFRVWYQGDDLNGPGTQIVPHPSSGISDAVGSESRWPNVPNYSTLTADRFAIMPLGNQKNVVKISIAAEQRGYYTVSCSELLFMEYDPEHDLDGDIAKLFANDLHTQLAEGVTAEALSALKARLSGDERNYCLYPALLDDELKLAEELLSAGESGGVLIEGVDARNSSGGSDLQPLGVTAKAGDEITIYASGIPEGQTLTIYATQFNSEVSGWKGTMGTLVNGRNVLKVPQLSSKSGVDHGGSLYLAYNGTAPEGISLHVRRAIDIPVLDLSDWYQLDEAARREAIGSYVDELSAYLGQYTIADTNNGSDYRNVTEIATPVVLLSLPAKAVNAALGGDTRETKITALYNDVLAWEDVMHICKTTHGIDGTYENNTQTGRQNIRCMTMFAGAFMYAAGNHVGIGYGSCAGMVVGRPIAQLETGAAANHLFGWGIAHEIGHNLDLLGKAEITNNIYSLMVQTYDGADNTLTSRLEASGKYAAVFNKVAQGYPGASNDVFVQLGLYWQLHLAYDGAEGDARGPMWFYNAFSKAWTAGTYTAGASSYDDKVALTAAGVVEKDLTEFFTRWGMVLSESTKAKLASYAEEPRAVWYLSDQSRRDRLGGVSTASGQVAAKAERKEGADNVVEVAIDASGLTGSVQGYEILRNGTPIAFVTADKGAYTDTIGSGNHRTYEYQVAAYDTLGNQIGSLSEKCEVRIAYDTVVSSSAYDIQRAENGDVVIALKEETAISGLKLDGIIPAAGDFTVTVTGTVMNEEGGSEEKTWTALNGNFGDNQAVDDPDSFVAYFKVPGAEADDTRIWTYDAKAVTITGIPDSVALDKVQLITYAGDDIAFLDGATMGLLAEDFRYGDGAEDVVAAGTLVIVGTYRGDPVYNTVSLEGEFTGTKTTESEELGAAESAVRPINGDVLLFATEPAFGEMCDISDGLFLFVPDVQREAALQNQDATKCDSTNLLPSRIRAILYRTDDPDSADSKRTTAQTLWISCPGGAEEDLPLVVLEGGTAE